MPATPAPPEASRLSASPVAPTAIAGVRVLQASGTFSSPQRVSWAHGRIALGGAAQPSDIDGTGQWLIPGLVDAHAHVAWHAFLDEDRLPHGSAAWHADTEHVLDLMLRAGFTSVRDAGGFEPELFAAWRRDHREPRPLPHVQASIALIDRAHADAAGGVQAATERVLGLGARWVKLVGTASVASPAGAGLEPVFTVREVQQAVDRAAEVGARVMLHAWGGQAIDDAIEAGVVSLEHGIFLTEEQAKRAAERDMTLVPTLRIYQLVRDMIDAGLLPEAFRRRVAEAVGAHPDAVRRARDAGLRIALGSDFSTPEQHGTNRQECDQLVRAGLTPAEALVAATTAGAELLALAERTAPTAPATPLARVAPGRIVNGAVADLVLLRDDPLIPGNLSAASVIAAVVLAGRLVPAQEHVTTFHDPHPRKDLS